MLMRVHLSPALQEGEPRPCPRGQPPSPAVVVPCRGRGKHLGVQAGLTGSGTQSTAEVYVHNPTQNVGSYSANLP